jgi:hypothetical protein
MCTVSTEPLSIGSGHLGRKKTYSSVSRTFWRPKRYKWTSTYVRTCETCQRVSPHRMRPHRWQVCLYPPGVGIP